MHARSFLFGWCSLQALHAVTCQDDDGCEELGNRADCIAGEDPDGNQCVWCTSAAVRAFLTDHAVVDPRYIHCRCRFRRDATATKTRKASRHRHSTAISPRVLRELQTPRLQALGHLRPLATMHMT
jgi:hypothetical protein